MPESSNERWPWRSHPRFIVLTIAIGQFSDYFMFGMRVPLLPYLIRSHLDVPEDEVQSRVASLLASFSIAVLVTAVPAGWLADFQRVRSKLYLAGLGVLLWATVTFYTSENYAVMVFSRMLNGVSAALLYAAGFAMVADAVGPRDLGKALGTVRSIASAGSLIGPPLGGFVFVGWGFDGILNVSLAVLMVDLVMRVLMVERRRDSFPGPASCGNGGQAETDQLLPSSAKSTSYVAPKTLLPILSCLSNSQLAVALLLNFIQYIILGSYDATLSMEAGERFGISPDKVGFVFLALAIPVLSMSAFAGWAVDRYGPRVVAMIGYGIFVPILASVSLLTSGCVIAPPSGLGVFCGLLCLQGGCLSLISTPAVVKAKRVVERVARDDPARFGTRGATGQLFGINSLVSSFGLVLGNYMSAVLREAIGYWGMNLVLAFSCGLAALFAKTFFHQDKDDETKPSDL